MLSVHLRRNDYSLDADQELLQSTFASFFAKEVPTSRVRQAEPLGYDAALWTDLSLLGAQSMGLPEALGGGGASFVDLALVAEEFGRVLAPVPLIEHVVAGRLLARCDPPIPPALAAGIADGSRIITLGPQPVDRVRRQLVSAGALTTTVVGLDGDELVLWTAPAAPPQVENLGSTPLAWWDLMAPELERQVLAGGPRARQWFDGAQAEWKLLLAAAAVGLGEAALLLGVEFAKVRHTLGVPIGALQGVAFPLADAEILLSGAKNLIRKAAWMLEHEPGQRPELTFMASVYAARAANTAATVSAHVHGGIGVSLEADITLFLRRAKGWTRLAGDPMSDIVAIGEHLIQNGCEEQHGLRFSRTRL
jgi:alkylation response protein AidB-like acyl-CoA dehydrogenase